MGKNETESKDVVEGYHNFWKNDKKDENGNKIEYLLSSKNDKDYQAFLKKVNEKNDKYAIFHPEDRKIIQELTENFEGKDEDNKFQILVDYANGLYDENLDDVAKELRPIIPQPAHFMAKDEAELKNVKVVVLTTNPGYTPRIPDGLPNDKIKEQEIMYKTLIGEKKFVPWDIPKKYDEDMEYLKAFADKSWHNDHFIKAGSSTKNSFIKQGLLEKNNVKREIMQIDYFPYQTKDSKSIPNFFLKSKISELLPSQEKSFDLLEFMIDNTRAIFICKKYGIWKSLIKRKDKNLFMKFEKRAFMFNDDKKVHLATTRIKSVFEQQRIDEIKRKARSKDGDIFIALKKLNEA